jgi:hypothetical protein
MEAYTRWVESAVWSVLAKSGLLSERERLPTFSLILLPQGYRDQHGQFRLEAEEGQPTQQIWFKEICLWKQVPQPWWEHVPGLMALYPLCKVKEEPAAAIAHAAAAIREHELDSYKRADLLTTLGFFGRLKDRTLDVFSIIRREEMKASEFFPEFVEEGRVEARRQDILQILGLRFGPETAKEFEQAVNQVANDAQLQELHKLAIQSRRVSQFRRALSSSST